MPLTRRRRRFLIFTSAPGRDETARLNGKQIGLPKGRKLTTQKSLVAKAVIRKHSKDFSGTLTDSEVICLTGIARNTYYKYKRELREAGE